VRKVAVFLVAGAVLCGVIGSWWDTRRRAVDNDRFQFEINAQSPTSYFTDVQKTSWDVVCRIDALMSASTALRRGGYELQDVTFMPEDRVIGEQKHGIVFLDRSARTARVFVLDDFNIYALEGERCLGRGQAFYRIDTVETGNFTYRKLTFVRR
jgi:hypothetical protein